MSIFAVLVPNVHDNEAYRYSGVVGFVLAAFVPRDIQTFAQTSFKIRDTLHIYIYRERERIVVVLALGFMIIYVRL